MFKNINKIKLINYFLDFLIIILFIIFGIVIFDNTDNLEEETKNNEDEFAQVEVMSEEIYASEEINGLKFTSSPVVTSESGGYRIEVKVKNITDQINPLSGFTLIIYDENNKKIDTLSNFYYREFFPNDYGTYMLDCKKDLLKDNYKIEFRPSYMISG